MTMSASQLSVFTFESAVHSSHVLRCLDEQRLRDMLCDVTVEVEGQSFRAHRSVLASCSEYFTHRLSSLTQHGAVIILPQEVTVAGFEPLLKFAYTSKLLFRKDDVVEIRNSALILGFRDLDEACFDFLLPKFFSSSKGSAPFLRKACCKKKCKRRLSKEELGTISGDEMLDEKEVKPVAESSSQHQVTWLCTKAVNSKMESQSSTDALTPAVEGANDHFMQCPKYRRQLACERETCEKSWNNPVTVIRDDCDPSSSPCSTVANSRDENENEHPGNSVTRQTEGGADDQWKSEIHDKNTEALNVGTIKKETDEEQGKRSEKEGGMHMKEDTGFSDKSTAKPASSGTSITLAEGSSGLILHHCPLKTFDDGPAIPGSLVHERLAMDISQDRKIKSAGVMVPASVRQKAEQAVEPEQKRADDAKEASCTGGGKGRKPASMDGAGLTENDSKERSTMEIEVAEHLSRRLASDMALSQLTSQDPDTGSSSETGRGKVQSASLEWPNFHVNVRSKRSSCPFFQDLDPSKCPWKAAELSECEGASQSGVSSLNSGEDGDSETETEGDSESYTRERARQVQLPFSVDWVVDLSRNDFQQLLKQRVFTQEQLEFVHDMRRRSKNRLAAQRCRKRKLDCIYNLQCEITKLKAEREKLITEKSQLGQLKLKTCHSVSALCQRVCSEANLQPEQLQVLAKYTSPDCPLSSAFPHIDTPLHSQHGLPPQVQASLLGCPVGLLTEAPSNASRDAVTGEGKH